MDKIDTEAFDSMGIFLNSDGAIAGVHPINYKVTLPAGACRTTWDEPLYTHAARMSQSGQVPSPELLEDWLSRSAQVQEHVRMLNIYSGRLMKLSAETDFEGQKDLYHSVRALFHERREILQDLTHIPLYD